MMEESEIDQKKQQEVPGPQAQAQAQEKLWNSNYLRAMTSNFLLFFSFFILTPLLPIYLDEEFGADKDMIGLVLAGYVVAALLVRPFSGFLVDTLDRRKVLMGCFLVFFVFFAGYAGAGTVLMFAIVRTLHGLPFGAVTVANSTVAIDVLPSSRRNEGIGYYGLSNNLAMAFAPSVGIWIYDATGNFQVLFWIAFFLSMVGFFMVSTIKTRPREKVANKPKLSLDRFFLTDAWLLAINVMLPAVCWGIMSNYVALYGRDKMGITDGTGVFFALMAVGLFSSRLIGAHSLKKGRIVQNCLGGLIIGLAAYTMFAAFEHPWAFYLSGLLLGLGNGHMYPAFLNMFISLAPNSWRGTANSSILTAWDAGIGLGMLLGGVLVEYVSYGAAFWTAACGQAVALGLFFLAGRAFYLRKRLPQT